MRSIPVKESAFVGLVCVMAPEAKLVDIDTGEVKKDRRSGQTVWTVGLCAMRGRDSSVIQVAVIGEPAGLRVGMPVQVVGLEAAPWERDGRSGVAWRAEAIHPATGSTAGPGSADGERGARAATGPAPTGTSASGSPAPMRGAGLSGSRPAVQREGQ